MCSVEMYASLKNAAAFSALVKTFAVSDERKICAMLPDEVDVLGNLSKIASTDALS